MLLNMPKVYLQLISRIVYTQLVQTLTCMDSLDS